MNIKLLNELGGALQRIAELSQKSIIESGDAAERRALEAYVQSTLVANAQELLASWVTVQNNYMPLVQGLSGVLAHVSGVLERRNAEVAAATSVNPTSGPFNAGNAVPGKATAMTEPQPFAEVVPDNMVQLKQPTQPAPPTAPEPTATPA